MLFNTFSQQEEIKKQTKLQESETMDAGTSFQQTSKTFGVSAPFGQSVSSFGSTGFAAVPSGTSNQSGLFQSANSTSQTGLFSQSSASGLTGTVFGITANSTNQATGMTGISSFPATNQSGSLFGTTPDQSAASTGLFDAKTDLKPGVFGSPSPTTSSGIFNSGPQLQKDSGTSAASTIAPNNSIVSVYEFVVHFRFHLELFFLY